MENGNDLILRCVMVLSGRCATSDGEYVSVFGSREFSHAPDVSYTNETLVRNGYLGASPDKPTLAISIELLEIYRQLRRVCPRFSLDALGRALSHIHHVRFSL